MKEKKLIEEIEADIVHYSARNLYFFIYDKEKSAVYGGGKL